MSSAELVERALRNLSAESGVEEMNGTGAKGAGPRCEDLSGNLLLVPLVTLGPLLNITLVALAAFLVSKLLYLLRNYAIAKASLISCAVCGGLVGLGSLVLDLELLVLFLSGPDCASMAQPFFACALLLQFTHNAFRLACLSLVVLALDRLYFAAKLHREIEHINHHNPSMYNNDHNAPSRCPPLHTCLHALRSLTWKALVSVLDRARIFFANLSIIFGTIVTLSLLITLTWWANLIQEPEPLHALGEKVEVCSEIGPYYNFSSVLLDRLMIFLTCWISLGAIVIAHKICQTQLGNFARSQYHITLGVRVKLRYTVTIAKMVFPPILANLVWQMLWWLIELILNLATSGQASGVRPTLVLPSLILWTKTPPLIFFCVGCLIRLKLENSVGPPQVTNFPPITHNFMSANTRTTHMREGTTGGQVPHPGAPSTITPTPAPTGGPRNLVHTQSQHSITSLPRQFTPARAPAMPIQRRMTSASLSQSGSTNPVQIDDSASPVSRHLRNSARRGSTIPSLPPINMPNSSYIPETSTSSDHRSGPSTGLPALLVDREAPSVAFSISQFYKTMETTSDSSSSNKQHSHSFDSSLHHNTPHIWF